MLEAPPSVALARALYGNVGKKGHAYACLGALNANKSCSARCKRTTDALAAWAQAAQAGAQGVGASGVGEDTQKAP